MLAYVNGKFLSKDDAMVSVFDHGFLYGDGVYETMRAYHGKIFFLSKHLTRLKHSADAISLSLPLPLDKIGEALNEALTVNKLNEAYIRIQISRGTGRDRPGPGALSGAHHGDPDQAVQGLSPGAVRERCGRRHRPDPPEPSPRARSGHQGHQLPEQHPREDRVPQGRGL